MRMPTRRAAYAVARALVLLHACCMFAAGYTVVHATPERIVIKSNQIVYFRQHGPYKE